MLLSLVSCGNFKFIKKLQYSGFSNISSPHCHVNILNNHRTMIIIKKLTLVITNLQSYWSFTIFSHQYLCFFSVPTSNPSSHPAFSHCNSLISPIWVFLSLPISFMSLTLWEEQHLVILYSILEFRLVPVECSQTLWRDDQRLPDRWTCLEEHHLDLLLVTWNWEGLTRTSILSDYTAYSQNPTALSEEEGSSEDKLLASRQLVKRNLSFMMSESQGV